MFSVSNSPRLGLLSESLAQIMITSNDIANGALELSPTSVKILESAPNVGVKLLRRGGTFGQVKLYKFMLKKNISDVRWKIFKKL